MCRKPTMLYVRRTPCPTCIYRKDSPFDIRLLEKEVCDRRGHFTGYRICHHHDSNDVCCRGFWSRHKDRFAAGQIAQRLGIVALVDEDDPPRHACAAHHGPTAGAGASLPAHALSAAERSAPGPGRTT